MTTKQEILELYQDSSSDELRYELQENQRLLALYEDRLSALLTRDPKLDMVKRRVVYMYFEYEHHFRTKIEHFRFCVDAVIEVLEKRRIQDDQTPPPPPLLQRDIDHY